MVRPLPDPPLKPFLPAFLLLCLLLFGGCTGQRRGDPEPIRLAALLSGNSSFDRELMKGLSFASAESAFILETATPEGAVPADSQIAFLRAFREAGFPDALIVIPASAPVVEYLIRLSDAGELPTDLPVMLIGRHFLPAEARDAGFIQIGSDHELAGRIAAGCVAGLLENSGDVYASTSFPDDLEQESRIRGFYSGISGHPGMRMVGIDYAFESPEKAFFQTLSIFQVHPKISAIFAVGEAEALGVYRMLRETGLLGTITFVSWGLVPELEDAMIRGYLDAAVVEDPAAMGASAIEALKRYFYEEIDVPERISTEIRLITDYRELKR